MTNLDIWIKVLENNGWKITDELTAFGTDTNILKFRNKEMRFTKGGILNLDIYFNNKTREVNSVFTQIKYWDGVDIWKQISEIQEMYKEDFRNFKIESLSI